MKRMLITTIVFTGVTLAFLFAMSVPSFAGVTPPTPVCNTACVGPQGQVKLACCVTDNDCSGAESNGWVCRTLPGGGGAGMDGFSCWDLNMDHMCDITMDAMTNEDINGDDECSVLDCQGPQGEPGPATCPSIIGGKGTGGSRTGSSSSGTFTPQYAPYFWDAGNNQYANIVSANQSVGAAGSIRGLRVRALPNVANGLMHDFEIQGGVPNASGRPACTVTGAGSATNSADCASSAAQCIDVNPGDVISLKAVPPSGTTTNQSNIPFNHTAVFNGCVCCDGEPPDDSGNCYTPPD